MPDPTDPSDPSDLSYTPDTAPPPPAAPSPIEPLPFDSVATVKSPVILGGTHGMAPRSSMSRTWEYKRESEKADSFSAGDDDVDVEVSLGDGLGKPADSSRQSVPATESPPADGRDREEGEPGRLREEVAVLEDRERTLSTRLGEARGRTEPPAKPAPSRPAALAPASAGDLRRRRDAAETRIKSLERSLGELRGRGPAISTQPDSSAASAPASGEREAGREPTRIANGDIVPLDVAGESLGRLFDKAPTPEIATGQAAALDPFAAPAGAITAGPESVVNYGYYAHKKDVHESSASGEKHAEKTARTLTPEDQTLERMKAIVVPEIDFRQASIKDIAAFFKAANREYGPADDTHGKELDFVVKGPPKEPKQTPATPPADPFAPLADADYNTPPVTLSARYINLYEAAKIVADVSGMKMVVRNDQVIFLPQDTACSDVIIRSYDVNGNLAAKIKGLVKDTGTTDLTHYFSDAGVSLPEHAAINYVPAVGKLRATLPPESLAEFERVLHELNTAPEAGDEKDEAPAPAARVPAAHHPFVETRANPFSTFAIDVDTASYTRTRQALDHGALPDPEAVRTEEIVNAFDYGDRAPDTAVFRVYVEGAPAPFGAGLDLVRIGVKGRRLGREEQRPAMLTFLVDASGSMDQPDRIGLARDALALLLEQLAPHDRLQLIAFDDHARLLLDATPAADRAAILAAFDRLQCRGSTNLEDGMREAYALAARAFVPGGENRVILISDGVANLGADSAADILARIDAHRRQGITCTVFGVGRGAYNDRMLEELANRGDGSYRFLDSPAEVRRAFVDDLAATLNTIATDVKIQVEWSPSAVGRYRQLGYENRALTKEQFRDDTVDAGEVGSGQSVTALYEIERTEPAPRGQPLGWVRVRYRRVDTQAIEEIERPILLRDLAPRLEAARPELRLAACAAEFAELLRRSPHAAGGRFAEVARLLRPVALEMKLDTRVAELARLVELAQGMGD
jgi:Ca-activated chloride channel family protein